MDATDKDTAPPSLAEVTADSLATQSAEETASPRGEWLRIALWMAVLIGISTTPYLVGYFHSTADWKFTGHLLPVPGDTCFHMSWAKQAAEGEVLFESKHNGATSSTRLVFNVLFLTIGWTSRLLHLPLEMAWQLVRIGIAILLFLTLYHFTSLFISGRRWKWFALVWMTTSAGFGWLEMVGLPNWWQSPDVDYWGTAPLDTYVVEVSTFWHMRWEVVTTPTVLLLVASFYFALKYNFTSNVKYMALAASMCLLMGFVHPHNLMTIYGTLFLYLAFNTASRQLGWPAPRASWRPWIQLLVLGVASIPAVAYYAYVLYREPVLWRYVAAQYVFGPVQLLCGYGLPGLLAIIGIVAVVRKRDYGDYFLVAWLLCGLLVLYVPIPPAGRVHGIDGLHIVICLLGTRGLISCCSSLERLSVISAMSTTVRRTAGIVSLMLVLAISSLSNVLRLANEFVVTSRRGAAPFMTHMMESGMSQHVGNLGIEYAESHGVPYFLPGELLDACRWLDAHTDSSEVVLGPDYVCTYVPYLAGNRVYYGHGYVTPEMWDRLAQIQRFYSFQQPETVRRAFLVAEQIDFVLFWSGQQVSGDEAAEFTELLEQALPLKLVYENARMLIFKTTYRENPVRDNADLGPND